MKEKKSHKELNTKIFLFKLESLQNVMIEIESSNFYENSAKLEGGSIAWYGKLPIIHGNNLYSKNSAKYGENIASFPIKMGVKIYSKGSSNVIYDSQKSSDIAILTNASSGNQIQYEFLVYILDYYDEIVSSIDGL